MKCEACLGMMDELIERELDDSLAREVNAHIAMCASCSQLYAQLRDEQERYGTYLQAVEPTPALWANLRLELERDRVTRRSHHLFSLQRWLAIVFESSHITPLQVTALVLITIGVAIGLMVWRTTTNVSRPQAQNPQVAGQPSSEVNPAGTNHHVGVGGVQEQIGRAHV